MDLTNREIAIASWFALFLVWALSHEKLRQGLVVLVKSFFARRLVVIWVLMALYIAFEVAVLRHLELWNVSHTKDTLLWAATVAIVVLVQSSDNVSYKNAALQIFSLSVIFDFIVNFRSLNLILELLLVPLSVALALLSAFSEAKEKYKSVSELVTNVMTVLGTGLIIYASASIYTQWASFASVDTAKDFLVPIALSLLFMPFVYLTMLYRLYEGYMGRLRFYVPDQRLRTKLLWCTIARVNMSASKLEMVGKQLRSKRIQSEGDIREVVEIKSVVQGKPPQGFRSLKWGDAPGANLRFVSSTSSDDLSMYKPTSCDAEFGLPVLDELYIFTAGQLYEVSVWLDGEESLHQVREQLAMQYGPPNFANEKLYLWKWKWLDDQIEIHLYFDCKFHRTALHFINNSV